MQRHISRSRFAIVGLILLCVGFVPGVHAQACSLSQVAGKWAFSTNGNVNGIGPRVSAGIFTLDAAGNVLHGKATSSLNGTVAPEFFSGTFSVNPDCSGEMLANVFDTSGNKLFTATLHSISTTKQRNCAGSSRPSWPPTAQLSSLRSSLTAGRSASSELVAANEIQVPGLVYLQFRLRLWPWRQPPGRAPSGT
jgi:hypothetical protein